MANKSQARALKSVSKGDQVANLKRLEWGLGTVTSSTVGEVVEVFFARVGPKRLSLSVARLISQAEYNRLTAAVKSSQKGKSEEGRRAVLPKLRLHSRRGRRLPEQNECNNCGETSSGVFEYSKSTRGVVRICSKCKPEMLTKSFGHADAQDIAIPGGRMESNRRRH